MDVAAGLAQPDAVDPAAGEVGRDLAEDARVQSVDAGHRDDGLGDQVGVGAVGGAPGPGRSLDTRAGALVVDAVAVGVHEDVVDGDVDLGDLEAGHPLDRADDVARIAAARSAMETPYSATMSRSTAAWRSPTSTATPWLRLVREPGIRSRRAPTARDAPPPRSWTPLISRVAMPAIFETTVSAMEVRPCSVTRAASLPLRLTTAADRVVGGRGLAHRVASRLRVRDSG